MTQDGTGCDEASCVTISKNTEILQILEKMVKSRVVRVRCAGVSKVQDTHSMQQRGSQKLCCSVSAYRAEM